MLGRYDRAMRARQPQGGAPFTPRSIGAAVWYDPSDLSTLFQDAAGTAPVTAVGQQVGRMLDKSGRGNHATQATLTSRPILQQDASGRFYLAPDGVDDWMVTPPINFTFTSKITLCVGIRKLIDGPVFKLVAELSTNNDTNVGAFMIGVGTLAEISRRNYALGVSMGFSSTTRIDAPHTAVISAMYDCAKDTNSNALQLIVNRISQELIHNTALTTVSALGNFPLYLFRRGGTSNGFDGRFYGLALVGQHLSAANLTRLEMYMNRKTGAY